MKHIYPFAVIIIFILTLNNKAYSQNIGINTDGSAPNANAMLDIKSENKGLLIPRTSTTSRIAIPNTKGLLVYDTTTSSFWYNDGSAWQQIANGAALNGTVNYLPKFTGTATVGNSQVVDNGQYVGIGTTNPTAGLNIIHNGGIIAKGDTLSANSYTLTERGTGSKFIWYPKRGALRAGFLDDDHNVDWNDNNMGNWSSAFGYGVLASGTGSCSIGYLSGTLSDYSFAEGYSSVTNGTASVAMGNLCFATGQYSDAFGNNTKSYGQSSFGMGEFCQASGDYSFAAGYYCQAIGDYSFAAGNSCQATNFNTVAMGIQSKSSGFTAVSLGFSNAATGDYSTALGTNAIASGNYSIALGLSVTAKGINSYALGSNVTAGGDNSFVYGNNSNTSGTGSIILGKNLFDGGHKGDVMLGDTDPWNAGSVGSGTDDQMICRFNNGYYFLTGGNTNRTGILASHGDNSWSQISDSTKKENIIPIDEEALLNKISKFRLCTWNYKGQDPKTFRHYGPMAQDFHAAFGRDAFGTIGNDTLINQADFLGVSFTAIQALEKRTEKIEQQQKQIDHLQKENETLIATNEKMQQQLQTLLTTVATLDKKVSALASTQNQMDTVAKK